MDAVEEKNIAEVILTANEMINIVIVEDDESQVEIYKDVIDECNKSDNSIIINAEYLENDTSLNSILMEKRIDALIVDLKLGNDDDNDSGNDIIEQIYQHKRIPIFVISGSLHRLREHRNITSVYKEYNRSDIDFYDVIDEIKKIFFSGYTKVFGHPGKIDKLLNDVFWKYAAENIETWYSDVEDDKRDRRFMRFITARMNEQLHYDGNEHDCYNSIEFYICPPNSETFFNGDIVMLEGKHYLVMTPACEIENRKCEKVMLCEIEFDDFETLKEGLINSPSNTKKQKLRNLINNKEGNIHFLPPTSFFCGGVVNFEKTMECDIGFFEEMKELKYRISYIFMKDIINRFSLFLRNKELSAEADFYSKQGQPEIDIDEILKIIKEESN